MRLNYVMRFSGYEINAYRKLTKRVEYGNLKINPPMNATK